VKAPGIGFIGAGMIGQVAHLANYVGNPNCRVVALAELRPELGRRAAARHGVAKVYQSHRDLLADPEVDAVVVVTRPHAHGPIVLEALEAGKHVLSEKPMAHTVEQAQRLVEAAERRKLTYAVGFMKRHDAGAQQAKATLDALRASGELGRVLLMRAWCYGGEFRCGTSDFEMTDEARPEGLATWPNTPDWIPADAKQDYAWFLNVFLHDLNLLRYLAGGEPQVRAVDFSKKNGRLAMLDFGEFPAVLEMAEIPDQPWQEGVEVLFERGRLKLEFSSPLVRDAPARVELTRGGAATETLQSRAPGSWAFRRQAEAFVADIRARREPLASARDAVNDLRLAEVIWRRHVATV
jgi:predicted dehydrogenase